MRNQPDKIMKKFALTLSFIYVLTNGLFAQDTIGFIKISGFDKKTKDAIQDSFIVTLADNHNSKVYKLKPNGDGEAMIKFLRVNKYSVSLSTPGYQTKQYNKVIVDGIHTTYLSFPLTSLTDLKPSRRKRKNK
jgi:hypothetical protein